FGHALGFPNSRTPPPANTPAGVTDRFPTNALDGSTNTPLSALLASTPADRLAAIQKVDQIVWTGSNVAAAVPTTLLFGRPELDVPTIPSVDGSRYGTAGVVPPPSATGLAAPAG